MKRNAISFAGLCAVVVAALANTGCPREVPEPPFNATGNYVGTYTLDDKQPTPTTCAVTMELYHLVEVAAIQDAFAGLAVLEWDCILSPLTRALLGIESDTFTAPVIARMQSDGAFSLNVEFDIDDIPAQLLALFDEETVDSVPLENLSLVFAGTGEDLGADGAMDGATGTFAFDATYEDGGTQTLEVAATFEITRVEP